MTKFTIVLSMLALILGMLFAIKSEVKAQNVVRNGNVFIQKTMSKDSTMTSYKYQDKDGIKHPIYLSSSGKAYIYVYSKKTGRGYRRYLPKITAQLTKSDKDGNSN